MRVPLEGLWVAPGPGDGEAGVGDQEVGIVAVPGGAPEGEAGAGMPGE